MSPILPLMAWIPVSAQPASSRHPPDHIPVHIVSIILQAQLGAVCLPLILILDEGARLRVFALAQSLGRLVYHAMMDAFVVILRISEREEFDLLILSTFPAVGKELLGLLHECFKLTTRTDPAYDLLVEILFC